MPMVMVAYGMGYLRVGAVPCRAVPWRGAAWRGVVWCGVITCGQAVVSPGGVGFDISLALLALAYSF